MGSSEEGAKLVPEEEKAEASSLVKSFDCSSFSELRDQNGMLEACVWCLAKWGGVVVTVIRSLGGGGNLSTYFPFCPVIFPFIQICYDMCLVRDY